MSFFESSGKGSDFKKAEYLKLTPGTHTIRIIESKAKKYYQHWLGSGGVECLGEECPQCKLNQRIVEEIGGDPQEAYKKASRNKVEGFIARQARGAVNVLDRTPIKICSKCGNENRPTNNVFLAACSVCGEVIVNVEPTVTNNVKIFSRAATVFEQIGNLDKAVLDENKEPIGVTNFDILLHVVGNNTVPVPSDNRDEVEFNKEDLYDLDTVVLHLTPDEMLRKMKGASFKEIFQARKEDKLYSEVDEDALTVDKELISEIQSEITDMF